MKVLVVGDVVGNPGRKTLKASLDKYKNNYDFLNVNGVHAAAGFGVSVTICD